MTNANDLLTVGDQVDVWVVRNDDRGVSGLPFC